MTAPTIIDCEQNSPEWIAARIGWPSASKFKDILAKGQGKMRKTYLHKLAGEILTGEPMDSFTNGHMERGHEWEDDARRLYEFERDVDAVQIGFAHNDLAGCSPDSLIGDNGLLEIKTALPHILVERHVQGGVPGEHVAQIQGQLWIMDRDWCDLMMFHPKLPPYIVRVERDGEYISNLISEIQRFRADVDQVVAWISKQEKAA